MANFVLSPKVEPNEVIELERAFFPDGHRGVLDLKRQLVVGNRGMGKSFWTHALLNAELRKRLTNVYCLPALAKTHVVIGFNGSEKIGAVAPTIEQVANAFKGGHDPELIWRAVLLRAARSLTVERKLGTFADTVVELVSSPQVYAQTLTEADDKLTSEGRFLIVVFDALDRLAREWGEIRTLTKALLTCALGLQSFRAVRAKIFMRVDQFSDIELFGFPDSSKIRNDHVNLTWRPHELYGLLLFELLRQGGARDELEAMAEETNTRLALPKDGRLETSELEKQDALVSTIAGEFMGGHKKRGRVYSWVPLH